MRHQCKGGLAYPAMTRNGTVRLPSQIPLQSFLGRTSSQAAGRIRNSMINGVRRKSSSAKATLQWIRGELIGKGSYGRVYMAFNATTGEVFAVKQVELPHKAAEATKQQKEVITALEFEGATLRDLDHPHIVRFLGWEENAYTLSIFLEYVPGGTIESCLKQHGAFSAEMTKSFTRQMLQGLEYLHSKGIIHRDLKSANILVEQNGVAKISDFGVSKRITDELDAKAFTGMKGTIFWMAPEVVDSKKAGYDTKVDIWSIGCMVIEMWSGVRPWFGQEVVPVMLKLYEHKSPPPVPPAVKLSANASSFRDACFAKDPSERLSAVELMGHPYLIPDIDWAFSPSELDPIAKPSTPPQSSDGTEKALPGLPPAARRHSRRLSISVPPPADRQRHVLHRIESEDFSSKQATLLPGPPLVFITPPSTPLSSTSNTTSRSEAVFNWAADASTSSLATSSQRIKNFYVVNPDLDSDSESNHDIFQRRRQPPPLPSNPPSSTILPGMSMPTPSSSASSSTYDTAQWYTQTDSDFGSNVWQRPPNDNLDPRRLSQFTQPPDSSPWHRPDLRDVYEHLQEFFPEHDIDKPVVKPSSDSSGSVFKTRNARRSIRMVAQEHLHRSFPKRGSRWDGQMQELIIR